MRTEFFIELKVLPCFEKMYVKVAEQAKAFGHCGGLGYLLSHGGGFLMINYRCANVQIDVSLREILHLHLCTLTHLKLLLLLFFLLFLISLHVIVNTTKWNDRPVGAAVQFVTQFVNRFFQQEGADQQIVFN